MLVRESESSFLHPFWRIGMAYEAVGEHARPLAAYLPDMCEYLQSVGGSAGWESRIIKALTGKDNIHNATRLSEFRERLLINSAGSDDFPQGSDQMTQLQNVVFHVLYALGVVKHYPRALEYRTDPELTFDEVIDRILSSKIPFPKMEDLGQDPKWGSFAALIPDVLKKVAIVNRDRIHIADRLRVKACQIAYRVSKGLEITDAERSLWLMLAPCNKRSFTEKEWKNHARRGLIASKQVIADSADPLMLRTFDDYSAAVQHGPYSKFAKLIYAKDGERITYSWGPAPRSLTVAVGSFELLGQFVSYDMEPIATIPWTEETQLAAIRERESNALVRNDRDPFILPPPVIASTPLDFPPFTSVDEREFRFSYMIDAGRHEEFHISEFDVDYMSPVTGRVHTTSTGTFYGASMLLYDKCRTGMAFGEGTTSPYDLSDFPLIDRQRCTKSGLHVLQQLAAAPLSGPAIVPGGLVIETIYWVKSNSPFVLKTDVELGALYYQHGSLLSLPPLREFVLAPREWAFGEDTVAELAIMRQLSLTEQQRRTSAEAIRVSHNMAKLAAFLSKESLPRISPIAIARVRLPMTYR